MWKSVCFLAVCFQVFVWGAFPTYLFEGQDNKATLWITDTLGSEPLTTILGENNEKYSEAFYLTAIGNKLYCAGEQQFSGSPFYRAILWITDLAGSSLNSITLADDGASSIASSITSAFQQIYCAGMQSNNGHDSATIWIRDLSGSLVKTATFQESGFNSTAYCIAASSNQLFLGGQREINGTTEKIASLWITDASASTEAVFTLAEKNNEASQVNSIDSAENKIFSVGQQVPIETPLAMLWVTNSFGGELTSIPIGIPGSWANSIYIKKPVASSINFYNAIHRFSPSQFQKGF